MSQHLLKHHGFCNSETSGEEGFVMVTVMMVVLAVGFVAELCPPRIRMLRSSPYYLRMLLYWVGQNVGSDFSVTSYGKKNPTSLFGQHNIGTLKR